MNFADFCCVTFYPKMSRYPKLCSTKFLWVVVRQRNSIYYSWTCKHFDKSFISKKTFFGWSGSPWSSTVVTTVY